MTFFVRRIVNSINYRVLAPLTNRDARNWASKTDFRKTHRRLLQQLRNSHSHDEAVRLAVGGEFDAFGLLLREALVFHGLKPTDYLIDVGCGSGRLAKPLAEYLKGKYLGIDVVPGLVQYARRLVPRPDWRFEVAEGLTIPEADQQAGLVCFFSVLTHLLHEESFVYLREAKRVLKPGGKIVLSFLDFRVASHWGSFESNLRDIGLGSQPMNVFVCPDMLREWAKRLEIEIETIHDGDESYLPLSKPITFEDGTVLKDRAAFGQSVCVMVRR
ncbi:MAG TPA: methyltransferase domain-containing protein [Pyrinomonadaceae bacterium]|nr:methyltransferase domain-containing protein [Pyrinomonadaceae bacterium]